MSALVWGHKRIKASAMAAVGPKFRVRLCRGPQPDDRGVNLNSGDVSMTNHSTAFGSVTPLRQCMVEDMVN